MFYSAAAIPEGTDVICEKRKLDGLSIGIVQFNRANKLNAISGQMLKKMIFHLRSWGADGAVAAILFLGAEEGKAFCVGGDIRALYQRPHEEIQAFFSGLNEFLALLKQINIPKVAIMNGFTMGLGLGIAMACDYRVATEKTYAAMPETGIGFINDSGSTYFLPRLQGGVAIGRYLGLTGYRMNPTECMALNLATHYMPNKNVKKLLDSLLLKLPAKNQTHLVDAALSEYLASFADKPTEENFLLKFWEQLRPHFDAADSFDTLSLHLTATLRKMEGTPAAESIGKFMKMTSTKCPVSLRLTYLLLTRGTHLSYVDCLTQEHLATLLLAKGPDFSEGIRAVVIEKGKTPPAWLNQEKEVSQRVLDAFNAFSSNEAGAALRLGK